MLVRKQQSVCVYVCMCEHQPVVWMRLPNIIYGCGAKKRQPLCDDKLPNTIWLGVLSLSLSLSFCISRPLLLYHFFSACLALLPLFFFILYCFSHRPKISLYCCRVVTRKRKNQKDHNTLLFVRFPRHQLELKNNLVIPDSPVSINTILHQIGAILTLFYETDLCRVPSLWLLRAKAACAHFP